MDFYHKRMLPFVIWPSTYWIGGPGEEHGGGYPYEYEPGGDNNPRMEEPLIRGYYDPVLKALAWYDGLLYGRQPSPYLIKKVIRALADTLRRNPWMARDPRFGDMSVRIYDLGNYMRTKTRYPNWKTRYGKQMRPEAQDIRGDLIEWLIQKYRQP